MSGTPRACSPDEFEKTQEQNRLTEEAIALYRRWLRESNRLYRAGGTTRPTPEMKETTAGEFQKSALKIFRRAKINGIRAISGSTKIVEIGPDYQTNEPSIPAIQTCVDGRSLRFSAGGQAIGTGVVAREYIRVRRVDGQLRLWAIESEVVNRC